MQRYHFHFKWRDDAVFDEEGIELENFAAAYVHACGLVQQVRRRLPASGSDWWIEISNGIETPTMILPTMVPGANIAKLRAQCEHRLAGVSGSRGADDPLSIVGPKSCNAQLFEDA